MPGPGAIYEVSGPFGVHGPFTRGKEHVTTLDLQGFSVPAMTRFLPGAAAFVAAILVALLGLYARRAVAAAGIRGRGGLVKIRLLGVNDFHGHLEAPRPGIGGAAWLKAHLDAATVRGRTIRVHAGDMIGATPLISSWFHDEPTMLAGTCSVRRRDARQPRVRRGRRRADPDARGGRRTGPGLRARRERPAREHLVARLPGAAYPYIAANTVDREGELERRMP